MVYHWGMNKFLLIGRGINQGWWLLVDSPELFQMIHKSVTAGLFLKFLHNPHFEKAYFGRTAIELASKWCETAEKFFRMQGSFIVNQNGGIAVCKPKHLDIIEVFETPQLCFPENKIEKRRITISRWYGGKHWYLQCQDKVIFEQEKYDLLDDAMAEARKYALEANIHVADSYEHEHFYMKEGD
jgi:hypothetical protein